MPAEFDNIAFEIDHIVAEKHHGPTEFENLALACFPCNNHKGPNIAGIDFISRATVPLFHPLLQTWSDHFQYNGPLLIGLSPAGRATIAVLEINLPYRISHRAALIAEGVFPPAWFVSS
jgi:hypothetical protein